MSKEAMKLALEALEGIHPGNMTPMAEEYWNKAITALQEALAEPDFWEGYVPEPVKPAQCKYPKCIYPCPDLPDCRDAEQPAQRPIKTFHGGKPWPVQKSAQQEPFGYFKAEPFGWTDCAETDEGAVALYQHPPAQRTWVDLTFAEICECENDYLHIFARAIEAKLKEKNT